MKKWWGENKKVWGTQENLAKHLEIGKSTIGDYIRGVSFPPPAFAEKIYGITHIDILKPKPETDPQMPLPDNTLQGQASNGESDDVNKQSIKRDEKSKVPEDKPSSSIGKQAAESVQESQSTIAERQEFFIPVFGFVWLYPEEVQVLNHPAVQSLCFCSSGIGTPGRGTWSRCHAWIP